MTSSFGKLYYQCVLLQKLFGIDVVNAYSYLLDQVGSRAQIIVLAHEMHVS